PDAAVGSANEERGASLPQRSQCASASEESCDQRCDQSSLNHWGTECRVPKTALNLHASVPSLLQAHASLSVVKASTAESRLNWDKERSREQTASATASQRPRL